MHDRLNSYCSLEEDLELLKSGEPGNPQPPISFELRMAVVYRAEKKKIMRSQINLIQKVISILSQAENALLNPDETVPSRAFTDLVLSETATEQEWRTLVHSSDWSVENKEAKLAKLEERFYYRRVINSTYWCQIKSLIMSGNFI